MSSPGNGATVSGTITVSATASDDRGVAGVQFKLNGANLGAEERSAPYAISWNTTSASNGSHSLTAVARDAAGNTRTSAPVTVTVSNDTTPPTVEITSPSDGATVSGPIMVTASAADAGGVAVVQLLVDGVELALDNTAPYEAPWDTRTAGDGTHTLQGRAQDAAGNIGASPVVTVTVANGAPALTRFEETAATLAPPAGAWLERTTAGSGVKLSGDRAVRSDVTGATATFTFTGTGVSWIGATCEICGIANVWIDGTLVAVVDTYTPLRPPASLSMFSTSGLDAASHTLMIEVTGRLNPSSGGAVIAVDAFDVTSGSGAGTRPASDTAPPTVAITSPRDGATVSGTVTVTANATDNVGVAGVQFLVGGATLGAEDTTAPHSVPWDTASASNGSHILTAVATDAAGNRTTAAPVTITVSNAPPPPGTVTRFEETEPSITFTADWTQDTTSRAWRGGGAAVSTTAGGQATFTFTGTSVSWIGFRGPQTGIARVSLDGVFVTEVDTFSTAEEVQAVVFRATGLSDASHTLTIEVTGLKNSASTETFIVVDACDVTR